jgi:glycosyltransferase involved in cell wall biosynthesis
MNILMIISKNDKYGAQRVFLDQVDALRRLGNQVVVVGRGNDGFVPESARSLGVGYFGIPMTGLKDLLFLRRLVKKYAVDVIHTSLDRADYSGMFLSLLSRKPRVSTMNVPRYHIGYRFADRIITLSNKQSEILKKKGIPSARITLIRPWIDVERYSRPDAGKRAAWSKKLGTDRFSIVFLHISSLLPQKGHLVSLDLVAECRRRNEVPLLIIAGDPLQGEYYASLVKKISDEGLKEHVYFTGWTAELPELLSLSHFTLLPSVHEAFGVVLLEGMAAGTPIVAREGEGGAELIEEYGTGYLYRPAKGVLRLADEVLDLWKDRDRYREMSDKCKDVCLREFTRERFGEKLVGLYRSLGRR